MADLSSLFQVAPTTAAGFVGQNQRLESQLQKLKQLELQQLIAQRQAEASQNAEMQPLKLEHQRLQNQGLSNGLEGILAESQRKTLDNNKTRATYDSDISTALSNNEETRNKNSASHRQRATEFLLQSGPLLESVPTPMRAAAFSEMVKQAGMNPDNPQIRGIISAAQKNPEKFPQLISSMADRFGQQAVSMNPAARVSRENNAASIRSNEAIHAADRASREREGAANRASRAEIAAKKAQGEVLDVYQQVLRGKLKDDEVPLALTMKAKQLQSTDPEAAAELLQMARQQEQMLYNRANARPQTEIPGIEKTKPTPAFGGNPGRGTGTAQDPIRLD